MLYSIVSGDFLTMCACVCVCVCVCARVCAEVFVAQTRTHVHALTCSIHEVLYVAMKNI